VFKISLRNLLLKEEKLDAVEHYHFGGIDFPHVTFLSNCLDSNASIKKKGQNDYGNILHEFIFWAVGNYFK